MGTAREAIKQMMKNCYLETNLLTPIYFKLPVFISPIILYTCGVSGHRCLCAEWAPIYTYVYIRMCRVQRSMPDVLTSYPLQFPFYFIFI